MRAGDQKLRYDLVWSKYYRQLVNYTHWSRYGIACGSQTKPSVVWVLEWSIMVAWPD